MKFILRVPMSDVYSYTEVICDTAEEYAQAKADYQKFKSLDDLDAPAKDFNRLLDEYLVTGEMTEIDTFHTLSNKQKFVFQEIKKSLKRTSPKTEQADRITREEY